MIEFASGAAKTAERSANMIRQPIGRQSNGTRMVRSFATGWNLNESNRNEGMEEQWEEGFTDGLDEACRQVNEYLVEEGLDYRFVNAGLNTVCKVSAQDLSYHQWQASCQKRATELEARFRAETEQST